MDDELTRRSFLAKGTGWLGASVLAGLAEKGLAALPPATLRAGAHGGMSRQTRAGSSLPTDSHGMIVYSEEYVTREMPVSLVDSWITPTEHFFLRNNEHMPKVNLAEWKLSITGEVARPLTLTMDELLKMEPRSVTNTLECAGNGRAFFQPRIRGVPWSRGGVGNAVFRGPSLGALLHRAGAKSSAGHVAFLGARLPSPDPPFVRSIPIGKALDPDTIVATGMNGLPLTPEHGYPARALVAGWIGSASIKWLTEIRVLTHELEGYFMDSAYRLPRQSAGAGETNATSSGAAQRGSVITALPVKSIIAAPADGSTIDLRGPSAEPVRIFGAAWAGESTVARVEVSADAGRSWQPAALGTDRARYAWRLWDFQWRPAQEGNYVILSRATDNRGRSQPLKMQWNPGGYLWNAADRVRVTVGRAGTR
jgi:DMSO/TMAO reductase YedYZ molybdopterin-dependent catalytic subunit